MKQTYIYSATKINDEAVMSELLIASYIDGSKFEEIFTSRALHVALNFTSLQKKF